MTENTSQCSMDSYWAQKLCNIVTLRAFLISNVRPVLRLHPHEHPGQQCLKELGQHRDKAVLTPGSMRWMILMRSMTFKKAAVLLRFQLARVRSKATQQDFQKKAWAFRRAMAGTPNYTHHTHAKILWLEPHIGLATLNLQRPSTAGLQVQV